MGSAYPPRLGLVFVCGGLLTPHSLGGVVGAQKQECLPSLEQPTVKEGHLLTPGYITRSHH